MKPTHAVLVAGLLLGPAAQAADVVDTLQSRYRAEGAGPFDAQAGKQLWHRKFNSGGDARSCTACHTADLRQSGKHVRTGKPIAPMAPSANPKRLSDAKKVEKWFYRNCKWTLGRTCTAQEKGDVLSFLRNQ